MSIENNESKQIYKEKINLETFLDDYWNKYDNSQIIVQFKLAKIIVLT